MDGEIAKVPQGRLGEMEEIADSIMFLASPLSSFMCGTGLVVGKLVTKMASLRCATLNLDTRDSANSRLDGGFTAGSH